MPDSSSRNRFGVLVGFQVCVRFALFMTKGVYNELKNNSPEILWFVAHTRPRSEKRVVKFCQRQGITATLLCYDSEHRYRRKTVVFRKPLFPGYVFLQLEFHEKDSVRQNDHVVNLLEVPDQDTFRRQLDDVLLALNSHLQVCLAPSIGEGTRVRIKGGPLCGLEGWVERRYGFSRVLLRLDFIKQAAAVEVGAELLEPT